MLLFSFSFPTHQRINIRRSIKKVPELAEGAMKATIPDTSGSEKYVSKS
jgi:hypothetical protein